MGQDKKSFPHTQDAFTVSDLANALGEMRDDLVLLSLELKDILFALESERQGAAKFVWSPNRNGADQDRRSPPR